MKSKLQTAGAPTNLHCEYFTNPLGLDELRPRLSWLVSDERRGAVQTAYQVRVASSQEMLAKEGADLWESGRVKSSQSVHVVYEGAPLASCQRVWWRVRTWDAGGEPSPWSEPSWWEMGLLARKEWQGQWIGSPLVGGGRTSSPCPYLRRGFIADKPLRAARLYATALGLYDFFLNGRPVDDRVFAPGWTEYTKRVPYQVYDVTDLLQAGENVLGAILGDGWYCGHIAWWDRQVYGDRPRLLAQLRLDFTDGSRATIATDGAWKWAAGPILESDMIMGECYDARREMEGWGRIGFDDAKWSPVEIFKDPGIALVAQCGPPVRRIEERAPVRKTVAEKDLYGRPAWIFDLGQNIVGRVRLKIRGKPGTMVRLRYGEMLQADGSLYTANLRSARATDYYTLKGGCVETYEPRFTFHGFRYVEVSDQFDQIASADVTGVVLHSDTPTTGEFECSHPLVNQLQSNIRWGQKGNFLEVPTDCPQRDERLGWMGDAQVFTRTAAFNMDVAAFFTKWQQDIADAQSRRGEFTKISPHVMDTEDGGPAWADGGIICPWTIHLCFGDTRLLERHYASLVRFVESMRASSQDLIRAHERSKGFHGFGDWLAVDAVERDRTPTPKSLIGTAYFAHDARLLSRIATRIGKKADAHKYAKLASEIRAAFNREFVTPGGRVVGHTQTGYLLALGFDLLPEAKRAAAVEHLVSDIERRGNHLSTGFVGTPLLAPVLSRFGRTDVAYRLLLQETYPSWLYTVKQGATTMWERWNSWTKEQGFGDVAMNSFNHYAYGAIGEWIYAVVGGIDLDPERPGYRHIRLAPRPGGGLTHARASLRSIHGLIECRWRIRNKKFFLDVTIPANTTATVRVPTRSPKAVTEGGCPAAKAAGLRLVAMEKEAAIFETGAGRYTFAAPAADGSI